MKRTCFILLFLVSVGLIATAALPYLQRPPEREFLADWTCHRYVAYALGPWQGQIYANSREGFERAYREGFRAFEVDLEFTRDGVLVATHGWKEEPPSLEAFRQARHEEGVTAFSFEELAKLLADRSDVYLILDTKGDPLAVWAEVERIASQYISLRERLIPQLYTLEAENVAATTRFPRVLLTLYKTWAPDWAVLWFLDRTGIPVVTMPADRWSEDFSEKLDTLGVITYVHTVNDPTAVRRLFSQGVHGVYSDSLAPPDSVSASCPSSAYIDSGMRERR